MPVPMPNCRGRAAGLAACLAAACSGGGGGGPPPLPDAWQRSASNPLLAPGIDPAPATTYELSIADPSVLRDPDTGVWHAWYSTTIFDSAVSGDPGRIVVKHATSLDAVAWTVQATPSLSSRNDPADWDFTHVETPCVVRNPDAGAPAAERWLMFYAGGNRDADTLAGRPLLSVFPYYQIGLAYSADGATFTRAPGLGGQAGLVLTAPMVLQASVAGYGDGLIADPSAIVRDGRIELWCSSFAESVNGSVRSPLAFGISVAHSTDGVTWTLPATNPLPSLFKPGDLAGGEQPAVLYDAAIDRYEVWFKNDTPAETATIPTTFFTAFGFWRAVSNDGLAWTPDYAERDVPWDPTLAYEQYGLLTGCCVVREAGVDLLFYSAWGSQGVPDAALYRVPLQAGGSAPAVITFAVASRPMR